LTRTLQQQLRNLIDLQKRFGILSPAERLIGGEPGGHDPHQNKRGDNQRKDRSDSEIHVPSPFPADLGFDREDFAQDF
jgi:hypothetical protein